MSLTTSREILAKIETTEGVPAYSGSSPTALEATDGLVAIDPSFTPEIEFEDPDIASGTLDTSAADVGLETGSISFGTYFRGTADDPTEVPAFDAAVRACGMTREALYFYPLGANRSGGAFVHGEQIAICDTDVALTAASAATECVLTTATHGIPTGMQFPVVLDGNTAFPTVEDLDNSINGAWLAESTGTTAIKLIGVDTSGGGTATFTDGKCYLPPIVTTGNIAITSGAVTTIILTGSTINEWTGVVGDQVALEIAGESGITSTDVTKTVTGRHLATVTVVTGTTSVTLTIDVPSTGTTAGTVTILGIPTAKVAGEYGEIEEEDPLYVYDEKGRIPEDMTVSGLGSKASATANATVRQVGGWRYRPIGERTFSIYTASAWTSSYIPSVGEVITRRNACGAYGRIVSVSTDGRTIEYEPYGAAFAVADGLRIVQGNGLGATSTVSTVTSTGGPSLTFEGRFGGVIYTYSGARGTFTVEYEVGKPIKLNFEFNGLKYTSPVDSVLAGVVIDETGKVRFLQGFSKTRNLSGLKVCDYSYEISQASIALNRSPTQKPDASSASGVKAYRHQETYVPEVTMDPAFTPVGVHAWDAIAAAGGTVAQLFGAGSSVGNRVLAYCPAVQYGASSFGDRDGERTVDFTGSCRKSAGNDAVQLFVY